MEIKAILEKPFSEEERINFVYRYQYGYMIQETEENLEAWGYTEGEIEQQEIERIKKLKMTKRVFALGLQEMGVTYTELKAIIATNEQAQLEWDLCVELERSNPLLDAMALQMGITSEQLDLMFRRANGENVIIIPRQKQDEQIIGLE